MNKLNDPMQSQLNSFRDWLRDRNQQPFLTGYEVETWADEKNTQYMCLNPSSDEHDLFTQYTTNVLLGLYHRTIGHRLGTGKNVDEVTRHTSYSDPSIHRATIVITTIVASLLPILTIYALNQIPSTNERIGVAAAFTAAFAFLIGLFSSARRVEIFAATAT